MRCKIFRKQSVLLGILLASCCLGGVGKLGAQQVEIRPDPIRSVSSSAKGGGGATGSEVTPTPALPGDEEYSSHPPSTEFGFSSPEKGKPQFKVNLDDCIRMAMLNNYEVRASDYDVMAAESKLSEAKIRGIPNLDYEFLSAPAPRDVDHAVQSFFDGYLTYFQRGKIAVGFPLYAFGKIGLAQDLARQGIGAEKEKRTDKKNDILLKVKKLYFGILLANDMRDLLQDAIQHMESEISRREANVEKGKGEEETRNPVELARLKLARFEILSRLSKLEKDDLLAHHALRIQMGLPRGTEFEIVEKHLRAVNYELRDFEYYLNESRKFRPESRLLEIGLRAKESQYRLEKRKIAPNMGIGALYEFGITTNSIQGLQLTDDFNDPFNFQRFGFGLRIDGDFNFRRHFAKVRQTEAEYFKTAFSKQAADEGLELDIRDAYLTVQQNKKNMENSDEAMKTARQYVFLTKTNTDIGLGDKKDYSDALQAYLLSRGRFFEAIYNYNIAVATLEQKAGGLARLEVPDAPVGSETEEKVME